MERTNAGDLQQDIGVVHSGSNKDAYHAAPDGIYVTFTEVEQDRKIAGLHERFEAEVASWEEAMK